MKRPMLRLLSLSGVAFSTWCPHSVFSSGRISLEKLSTPRVGGSALPRLSYCSTAANGFRRRWLIDLR